MRRLPPGSTATASRRVPISQNRFAVSARKSAGIQYKFTIGDGSLTPRIDAFCTPGYCGNLACSELASNEAYTLVNARLTYRSPERDWSLSLEATNLTDKLYYLDKLVTVYANGQPGCPREFDLTVRKNF